MRRIASHVRALQTLIESLTVGMIAEPIETVSVTENVAQARHIMRHRHFDVLGVRDEEGKVVGYIEHDEADDGKVKDACKVFAVGEIVCSSAPLRDNVCRVADTGRIFVLGNEGIESIVTVADLRKPPVRLLIFGGILVLEMALLEWVREQYPDDDWTGLLSKERLSKAKKVFGERQRENRETDLAECLYLSDKAEVLKKTPDGPASLGFESKQAAKRFFGRLRGLRDNLAHARHPDKDMEWSKITQVVDDAEKATSLIVQSLENVD